jgi:hypothetical protein
MSSPYMMQNGIKNLGESRKTCENRKMSDALCFESSLADSIILKESKGDPSHKIFFNINIKYTNRTISQQGFNILSLAKSFFLDSFFISFVGCFLNWI